MRATAYHNHATTQGRKCAPSASRPRPVGVGKPDGKARVPEQAIKQGGKISPAAFRLYCYYCARRNHETGGWRVRDEEAAKELDLSRSRVCEARNELSRKGWITDQLVPRSGGSHFIKPLMGFEEPGASTVSVEAPNEGAEAPNESVGSPTLYIDKERARGFTSHLPPTLPPTTPTPRPPAAAVQLVPPPANAPTVVVCEGSKFSLEDCRRYADYLHASRQGVNNPGGFAKARHRDGTADAEISAYLAREYPERVKSGELPAPVLMNASACPDCRGGGMYYPDPAHPEKGVARCRHSRLMSDADQATDFMHRQAATASPNTGAAHSTAETPHTVAQR